jgi:hypothetical protein
MVGNGGKWEAGDMVCAGPLVSTRLSCELERLGGGYCVRAFPCAQHVDAWRQSLASAFAGASWASRSLAGFRDAVVGRKVRRNALQGRSPLAAEEAVALQQLPMEFLAETQKLIGISLDGSVG